jgi:hypothetical protein
MTAGELLFQRLGGFISLEHQHHRLTKSPAQVGIADLLAGVTVVLAV